MNRRYKTIFEDFKEKKVPQKKKIEIKVNDKNGETGNTDSVILNPEYKGANFY